MNSLKAMSGERRLRAALALIAAAPLAACSSSDSGGGGATTPPPPSPPPASTVELTLEGTVTDAPIPNAAVTATVGDETFSATADANGNYTLEMEVDETDADEFVTLHAEGVNEQSFVAFTSLAGSFQTLSTQAGDDGTLTREESFKTQITNVSTAEAVLLMEANEGEPITSDEQLETLSPTVNGQDVLDLASAIKLAVDSAEDYPLPEGVTSIADVISDPEVRQAFVSDAMGQDQERFSETQTAIAEDSALTQPVSADDLPERLTATITSAADGFSFNLYDRVADYRFNDDGTGVVARIGGEVPMTWDVQDSKVHVSYSTPINSRKFYSAKECEGTVQGMFIDYRADGAVLAPLSDRTLTIKQHKEIIAAPACPGSVGATVTETTARTVLGDDDFEEIVLDMDESGEIWIVRHPEGTDIADVDPDGTGITRQFGRTFTWSLEGAGRDLVLTFDDSAVTRYRVLAEVDEFVDDVIWEITTPAGETLADAGMAIHTTPDEELALMLNASNVPGRYYLFGVGPDENMGEGLEGFRMRFDPDGTGAFEDDYLDEAGAVVTLDETADPAVGLRWSLEGNTVIVRRTRDQSSGMYNCLKGAPDCLVWDELRITPLAMVGPRLYWFVDRRFGDGIETEAMRIRLPRFSDYEPLTD